jgi:hypothetical protein
MQWIKTCIVASNCEVRGSVCSGSKRVYFRVIIEYVGLYAVARNVYTFE